MAKWGTASILKCYSVIKCSTWPQGGFLPLQMNPATSCAPWKWRSRSDFRCISFRSYAETTPCFYLLTDVSLLNVISRSLLPLTPYSWRTETLMLTAQLFLTPTPRAEQRKSRSSCSMGPSTALNHHTAPLSDLCPVCLILFFKNCAAYTWRHQSVCRTMLSWVN